MFIDAPIIKVKVAGFHHKETDGLQFSKNIEAAILEKEHEGYELFSINPVHAGKASEGIIQHGITIGMILTFKKMTNE